MKNYLLNSLIILGGALILTTVTVLIMTVFYFAALTEHTDNIVCSF